MGCPLFGFEHCRELAGLDIDRCQGDAKIGPRDSVVGGERQQTLALLSEPLARGRGVGPRYLDATWGGSGEEVADFEKSREGQGSRPGVALGDAAERGGAPSHTAPTGASDARVVPGGRAPLCQ